MNGTIFAKEVLIPREGGCQDVGYNIWEIVNMRKTFLKWIEEEKGEYDKAMDRMMVAYHGSDAKKGPYKVIPHEDVHIPRICFFFFALTAITHIHPCAYIHTYIHTYVRTYVHSSNIVNKEEYLDHSKNLQ